MKQIHLSKEHAMSRLSPSSVAGSAAAILIALATAAALAQNAPTGTALDPKAAQPAKQATSSMKPLTPQGPLPVRTNPVLKAVQPSTTTTLSTKPLTPQGPLASKPAPTVMSPGSTNLATRPLPATTSPPHAASGQAPAAPPPGGAKKCGERKGDC